MVNAVGHGGNAAAAARVPDDPISTVVLTDPERDRFGTALADLPASIFECFTGAGAAMWSVAAHAPDRLIDCLLAFRRHGTRTGRVFIRNLPTDPVLPPTPEDGRRPAAKRTQVSESVLLTLMSVVGDVMSYTAEKSGTFVQEVTPIRGRDGRQENSGSVAFDLHTENAFHQFPPDYVGLYCLRADGAGGGRSILSSLRIAAPRLSAEAAASLRRPVFTVRPPSSFPSATAPLVASPVFAGPVEDPTLRIDFHHSAAPDAAAARVLNELRDALVDSVVTIDLVPGDVIIIDNVVAAHGRTAFRPRYDGTDRWLQRAFAVRDLRTSRGVRDPGGHRLHS
jgi:L-asparagine oxygenase